jgi:hypothetical protein
VHEHYEIAQYGLPIAPSSYELDAPGPVTNERLTSITPNQSDNDALATPIRRNMTESKLEVGSVAPEFKLRGVITKPEVKRVDVQLSDYRGEQNIVIAFHPFAFTAT